MTGPIVKLTVNLVPSAQLALDDAALLTGDTKTDTVNRALQLYGAVVRAVEAGATAKLTFDSTAGKTVELLLRRKRRWPWRTSGRPS